MKIATTGRTVIVNDSTGGNVSEGLPPNPKSGDEVIAINVGTANHFVLLGQINGETNLNINGFEAYYLIFTSDMGWRIASNALSFESVTSVKSLTANVPSGSAPAIIAEAASGPGVFATSNGGNAVVGASVSGIGGWFTSTSGIDLKTGPVVVLEGLPTADPHVVNQLWNSAGTLKVSAGP